MSLIANTRQRWNITFYEQEANGCALTSRIIATDEANLFLMVMIIFMELRAPRKAIIAMLRWELCLLFKFSHCEHSKLLFIPSMVFYRKIIPGENVVGFLLEQKGFIENEKLFSVNSSTLLPERSNVLIKNNDLCHVFVRFWLEMSMFYSNISHQQSQRINGVLAENWFIKRDKLLNAKCFVSFLQLYVTALVWRTSRASNVKLTLSTNVNINRLKVTGFLR